jgi:hypothetical protein
MEPEIAFEDLFDLSSDGASSEEPSDFHVGEGHVSSVNVSGRFAHTTVEDVFAAQQTNRPNNSVRKTEWVRRLFVSWKSAENIVLTLLVTVLCIRVST